MKHKFLSILMAALVAVTPVFAQQARNGQGEDKEKEAAEPKTGVRFVNCSPAGVQVPDLFTKVGKSYKKTRITMRMPSRRIKPVGGEIAFYDEDPTPTKDKKGGKGAKEEKPDIQPVMTFKVPDDLASGKTLCIVMPESRDNPFKVNSLYIKESAFPKNGVYIINLTDTPLQMKVSTDADFKDAKVEKIGPFTGGIGASNTWSSPKGADGTEISFILSAQVKGSKEPRRIKASRFALSSRQSQINVVVKDPARQNSFSLQTIQLVEKKDQNQGEN